MATATMRPLSSCLHLWIALVVTAARLVTTQGDCQFPATWAGQWFQLGLDKSTISINSSHIETKGDCANTDGDNKFLVHDRKEKCYRCIAMYEKHNNVLQYKETYCEDEKSLDILCNKINGDALLLSMFRVDASPVTCPFKTPPFSVVYNKGHGECGAREGEPPSRAESCTDDTRLVFKFQACPDVPSTEAAVEELECLATWRESSNHYLVGRLHHKMATTDEERYRCFMFRKTSPRSYEMAQSGEATCSGMVSPVDGSRTIKLTRDSNMVRCKFPQWVTQHYHWRSLDYSHSFHFSHKNASLKVASRSGEAETKMVCHTIVTENLKVARIVVHAVSGCEGGFRCMTIHKRDFHVIQMQQSILFNDPSEANAVCVNEEMDFKMNDHLNSKISAAGSTITMITAGMPSNRCPLEGRYSAENAALEPLPAEQCGQQTSLHSLAVACNTDRTTMEFQSNCRAIPPTSYSCHGSWRVNSTTYVVGSPVSRHSTDARHYCFVFTSHHGGGSGGGGNGGESIGGPGSRIILQRVAETCATSASPVEWTFNITETGKCSETSGASQSFVTIPPIFFLLITSLIISSASLLR